MAKIQALITTRGSLIFGPTPVESKTTIKQLALRRIKMVGWGFFLKYRLYQTTRALIFSETGEPLFSNPHKNMIIPEKVNNNGINAIRRLINELTL
jgi:hypothetical protein